MIPSNGKSLINRCCLLRVGLIQISLVSLAHSFSVKEALNDLTPSIIPITARAPVETLLIQSKKASTCGGPKPVCVTILHGGPHATSTTSFFPAVVALALEGCASLSLIRHNLRTTILDHSLTPQTPSTFPTTQARWDSAKDTSKSSSDTAGAWTSKTSPKASGN